ncbi:hypothetical protein HPB51_008955 [Rhipicephalus microplus]|uniref:Transposable element P transposase-like RNase H C-terminal domain-containing protein n=1 Tax=Rhipicephalus microplus TaxID=6941 RepID=A0A9J6D4N1_RHIMP|nr:hypothetical protein HPB51_008955 [Rhipicephalus microplus]
MEVNQGVYKPGARPFAQDGIHYSGVTGRRVGMAIFKTSRKTAFLGFLVSIESTIGLASSLLLGEAAPLHYLLMYKLSQDHIEFLFAAIRCKGGWNNNPTVAQFVAAYKRLVVHTEVKGGRGNCDALDETQILYVSSGIGAHDELDMTVAKQNGGGDLQHDLELSEESELEREAERLPSLLPYIGNITSYIAGFVASWCAEGSLVLHATQQLCRREVRRPSLTGKSVVDCKSRHHLQFTSARPQRK